MACSILQLGAAEDYFPLATVLTPRLQPDPSGPTINVPRKPGPEADATLIALARQINTVDDSLRRKASSGALSEAQLGALIEARNVAAARLMQGRDVLAGTSGGEFPAGEKRAVDNYLSQIMKGLDSPKGRDVVKTNIVFAGLTADVALLYQSYANHSFKSPDWSTYTPGDSIRVGTYIFKVKALATQRECEESVPVLAEPTERRICGAFRP